LAIALAAATLVLAACEPLDPDAIPEDRNLLSRADAPVALEGTDLPTLIGVDPDRIVAFRHRRSGGEPSWIQIPVQVDERAVVDFGTRPSADPGAGTVGTVYGTTPAGIAALQYTDATTFVGADPDPTFDTLDELVFMSGDAGGRPRPEQATEPGGIVAGSGVEIELTDPIGGGRGWVYLFEGDGTLDPAAGANYVDYQFTLASGPYASTYNRGDGPNPETSVVSTDNYEVHFVDRWMDADWRITAGEATGVDVLDGLKFRFGFNTCGRSNVTFSGIDTASQAPGAFAANIDGPVRAVRSFIGANSGTYTQRTNIFTRHRQDIVTDLRVHAIPGIIEHLDWSEAAIGMTYRNSAMANGVTIDGIADAAPDTVPAWETVSGPQGTVHLTQHVESDLPFPGGSFEAAADFFYLDELNSAIDQCWGDPHFLGASGFSYLSGVPNTDPAGSGTVYDLRTTRHITYSAPVAADIDLSLIAAALAAQQDAPPTVVVSNYLP